MFFTQCQQLSSDCIFVVIIFSLMSGKLDKQQQVQVVIRLKPIPKDLINTRSVYVSQQQQKTLVVQTPNKKEYFVFDNIADDQCSQQEIYQYIGQDAVKSSTDGYNCCIFAYGQTGAGKTYSILGNSQDLVNDYYTQSRGILPRLLSDLFSWCSNETDRFWIKCSYLEIYNQQIIDLLNPELKLRQIREDFKKGVFVQGLSQQNATNYQEAMSILLKGIKNRKTSATSMNDQSSRSHTIFTLNIQSEFHKDDITKIRRSKINIVDLAGSQRAKQTKVQGDRLKQGCNINRSLHVLGNVINALVQSTKKKKHIPFRDSKLTHFLKDSLSGNSITKLLANIHPSKSYLGDTLSTLMFAKRAKILKMKVQVNENMTQNFQQLRKQIRKLRQQLAEARYIKNQEKVDRNVSESQNDLFVNVEKVIDVSNFDTSKNDQILQVFEQNQLNYKALIEIYQEHMKICSLSAKTRKSLSMHQEWKNIQRKNESYRNLVKNIPAFTKIFKQNIQLKNKSKQWAQKQSSCTFKQIIQPLSLSILKHKQESTSSSQLRQLKTEYQTFIKQIQTKFTNYIKQLQSAYEQLQNQNKLKQERIKQLRKRKQLPPDMEELINQNEYLKLNILQLEDQVNKYQDKERKLQIQIKQLKKQKQKQKQKQNQNDWMDEQTSDHIQSKLHQIKQLLDKEAKDHQQQRNSMLAYIDRIKQKLKATFQQNKVLMINVQTVKQQNKGLRKKLQSLLKISNEIQITKDQNTYATTFWTNQESNYSDQLQIFKQQDQKKNQNLLQKQELSRLKYQTQIQQQKSKGIQLSNQIIKLHKSYNEQIDKLKQQVRSLQKIRKQLTDYNYQIITKLRKFQLKYESKQPAPTKQRPIKEATKELKVEQVSLTHVRSMKTLQKFRQPKPVEEKQKNESVSYKQLPNFHHKRNILHIREEKQEKQKSKKNIY